MIGGIKAISALSDHYTEREKHYRRHSTVELRYLVPTSKVSSLKVC